jgi:electron-transferring-flavoprotein dehydrogenase
MLVRYRPSIRRTFNIRGLRTTIHHLQQQREIFDPHSVERASDDVDVCIVGGGPAGLSAAIRLKQLEREKGKEIRVVVLEKGAEVGEFLF